MAEDPSKGDDMPHGGLSYTQQAILREYVDGEHVAATVVQWLGSPVGQQFLAICGYTKKESK